MGSVPSTACYGVTFTFTSKRLYYGPVLNLLCFPKEKEWVYVISMMSVSVFVLKTWTRCNFNKTWHARHDSGPHTKVINSQDNLEFEYRTVFMPFPRDSGTVNLLAFMNILCFSSHLMTLYKVQKSGSMTAWRWLETRVREASRAERCNLAFSFLKATVSEKKGNMTCVWSRSTPHRWHTSEISSLFLKFLIITEPCCT